MRRQKIEPGSHPEFYQDIAAFFWLNPPLQALREKHIVKSIQLGTE
ncbi:MAG TPA: hypothetical protein VMG30_03910 [Acidobacteriota bacterium]|nr:hypothetical protein [Acidobacteriota bacterium]